MSFGSVHKPIIDEPINMEFYCDSDFAVDMSDRKSSAGWLGIMNDVSRVSTSTAEAEYISLFLCTMDIIWLCQFLIEIGFDLFIETVVHDDNAAAVSGPAMW